MSQPLPPSSLERSQLVAAVARNLWSQTVVGSSPARFAIDFNLSQKWYSGFPVEAPKRSFEVLRVAFLRISLSIKFLGTHTTRLLPVFVWNFQ